MMMPEGGEPDEGAMEAAAGVEAENTQDSVTAFGRLLLSLREQDQPNPESKSN
jgi:hypothetical protein